MTALELKTAWPQNQDRRTLARRPCELYGRDRHEEAKSRDEHLRHTYAKRGWSPTKIERAVAQSLANKKRNLPQLNGYRADIVDLVTTIVARTTTAALLVHMYSGDLESERIEVGVSLETDPAGLGQATPDPDEWLWIREHVAPRHAWHR